MYSLNITSFDGNDYTKSIDANGTLLEYTAKLEDGVYTAVLLDSESNMVDSLDILAKCHKQYCINKILEESLSGVDGCRKKIDKANAILQLAESAFEFKSKHGTADALMKLECDGCDNCGSI